MSDTPETNAMVANDTERTHSEWISFARKLERERDEAREIADDLLEKNAKQAVNLVKWRDTAERYRLKTLSQDAERLVTRHSSLVTFP